MSPHVETSHKIDLLIPHDLIWCSTQIFDLDQKYDYYSRNKPTIRYLDVDKDRAAFRLHKVPRGCMQISIAPLVEVNGMLISEADNQTRVTAQATMNRLSCACTTASFSVVPVYLYFDESAPQLSAALRMAIAIIAVLILIVLTFFWIEWQKRQLLKLIRQALTGQ